MILVIDTYKEKNMKLPQFYQQPHFLRATFHINTPMFAAGENQKDPELTPTSFKGVLRFWWRALNWSKIRLDFKDKESALKQLHKQEASLFGLAANDTKGGQGDCLINLLKFESGEPKKWQYSGNKSGINYLLGQGLFRDGLTRDAFLNGQTFIIDLTVAEKSLQSIKDTLQIIGFLGGFGSRSRHGFGSVTLTKLEEKSLTQNSYQQVDFEADAFKGLSALLSKYQCKENKEVPPLSAFYKETKIDIVDLRNNDAIELLHKIGEEQQMYRSFGRNGEVGGEPAEQNFKQDHDFILNMMNNNKNTITHPKRVVFGLPHNYFYSGNNTSGHRGNVDASTGRRASPLIIHIHLNNKNQYQVIHCLLKSEFLPSGATINIKAKKENKNKNQSVLADVDWQVIEGFMNRSVFNRKETI